MFEHNVRDTRMHDVWDPPDSAESRSLMDQLGMMRRRENRAAAQRLRVAGELFEMRRRQRGEAEDWAVDTWAAVGAEIAAALSIGLGRAGSWMHYGLAMRRLPAVAAVFEAGAIDIDTFRTIAYRTEMVTDADAAATLDRSIAARAARWGSLSQGRMAREIDQLVNQVDRDAVRRRQERARDRDVTVYDAADGTSDISGRLFATDAAALDHRLDALAATVCPADPRTTGQRRADALGALAAGAERLMCRCGTSDCPAAAAVASAVVIHVVADQATLEGRAETPGHLFGADTLISAELLREIAAAARLRPLIDPAGTPPEPRYRPSAALADFIRARDLTCRAPGCDRPATDCDLDHTVPYRCGGATHASNMKALCRFHHILKTFWGWRDCQLPDGTVLWRLPGGRTHVTSPGSAQLFPALGTPTPVGTAAMPRRRTTRSMMRAQRIAAERAANRRERQARDAELFAACPSPFPGDEAPPF